ncbi:uncharacterized protein [Nyctibius grandis]|uniref:uncharacterized protein n=1 Tax=Nyctibius grandis TaxID=48427 RepID=UPI0035BBC6B9
MAAEAWAGGASIAGAPAGHGSPRAVPRELWEAHALGRSPLGLIAERDSRAAPSKGEGPRGSAKTSKHPFELRVRARQASERLAVRAGVPSPAGGARPRRQHRAGAPGEAAGARQGPFAWPRGVTPGALAPGGHPSAGKADGRAASAPGGPSAPRRGAGGAGAGRGQSRLGPRRPLSPEERCRWCWGRPSRSGTPPHGPPATVRCPGRKRTALPGRQPCAAGPGPALDMDNVKDEKSRMPCATSQEELKARGKEKRKRKRSRSRSSSISSTSSSSTTSTSSSSSRSSSRSSSSSRDSPKSKSKKKKKEKQNKKKRKKENKMKKKKEKKKKREKPGPVQLSKFFKNKKKNENYSMITGKKIKMRIKKTKKDKERDRNRAELLEFLNSAL